MSRKDILSAIKLQMQQEQRSGIGYWCDPSLDQALRGSVAQPQAAAPARISRPATAQSVSSGTRRFAKPPDRLDPDAPSRKRTETERKPVAKRTWGPPPKATGREKDWAKKLAVIEKEVKVCTQCPLSEDRTNTVFGVGDASVPLVFVGEAPGAEEDRQGIPFVGRAGNLLTKIIAAIGLSRDQVYICNVLKCRPPGNRDPHPDEIVTCSPYLDRQLALLKPKVICTLGRHSTLKLTGQAAAMKTLHGQFFEYQGYKVMPTYHPAALLRNPSFKALVWEDVQKLRDVLDAK